MSWSKGPLAVPPEPVNAGSPSLSLTAARERLLSAALRCLSAERVGEHADKAASIEYADEELALAARELAEATHALPKDRQPVGWPS